MDDVTKLTGVDVVGTGDPGNAQQWIRKVSLIVGQDSGRALDLSDLRIVFAVKRGDTQTPNSLRARIYNVAPETVALVQKEFKRVVLQAGYEGNYGIIFDGTIIQARYGRASAVDTYLDITAGDGDSAYNFAIVSTTLAAGATQEDCLRAIAQSMEPYGVTLGYIPELPTFRLPRGKTMCGMARNYMRDFARTTQTTWSIQDGKIQVVPETSYLPGEVVVINSQTGMVGMPEQMQNGIRVKMLLNPNVKISRDIELNNSSIQQFEYSIAVDQQADAERQKLQNALDADGHYVVIWIEHFGDTRGNDWYSEATCLAIDATIPKEFVTKTTAADPLIPTPVKPYG